MTLTGQLLLVRSNSTEGPCIFEVLNLKKQTACLSRNDALSSWAINRAA